MDNLHHIIHASREVTDTKIEIQARYVDVQVKDKSVKDKTIGGHSWKKDGEIFPRSLEDRYRKKCAIKVYFYGIFMEG